jgi:hypothetical protein
MVETLLLVAPGATVTADAVMAKLGELHSTQRRHGITCRFR